MWLLIFVLWFVAPPVELAVILALWIVNGEKKRKIQDLETKLRASQGEGTAERQSDPEIPEVTLALPQKTGFQEKRAAGPLKNAAAAGRDSEAACRKPGRKNNSMPILALLAGIIFVVLAGLIFATTAWQILPNPAKVLLVAVFSGMFFCTSYLAEKRLGIHRTGNALYVLGSIFAFLSVLAAAYFQLLGPAYVLAGQNRWRVLWVGSLVTVVMLFLGIRRFHDRVYTQVCFWGMTVSVTFWLLSCKTGGNGEWLSAMMVYAWLLMAGKRLVGKRMPEKKSGEGIWEITGSQSGWELLREGFSWFAPVHFWGFSFPVVFLGSVNGFFQTGWWLHWYVAVALGAVILGIVMQLLEEECEWKRTFLNVAVAGTIHYLTAWIAFEVSGGRLVEGGWAILAAEMFLAVLLLAGKGRRLCLWTEAGGWIAEAFLMGDVVLFGCRLALEQQMTGNLYVEAALRGNAFRALAGALILAVVLAAWRKYVPARYGFWLLLWYAVRWPLEVWLRCELACYVPESLKELLFGWFDRGMLCFLMLCGMVFWEKKNGEGRWLLISVLGTCMQMIYFSLEMVMFPFSLLLSGFLLSEALKGKAAEGKVAEGRNSEGKAAEEKSLGAQAAEEKALEGKAAKEKIAGRSGFKRGQATKAADWKSGTWGDGFWKGAWLYRAAALYAMVGVSLFMSPFTEDNRVITVMAVVWVYGIGRLLEPGLEGRLTARPSREDRSVFWDACGCLLAVGMAAAFYGNPVLKGWNLAFCLAVCGGFYGMFYLGDRIWPHLLVSLAMVPMPFVLASRYGWTENQENLIILVFLALTGIVVRRRLRICEPDEKVSGGWRVDWYQVLAAFVLVIRAVESESDHWTFFLILVLALYFLQYGAVREWRAFAWSAAAGILVLAYWNQPFGELPSRVWTELQLLPAAAYVWCLGRIWRRKGTEKEDWTGVEIFLFAGYLFCLVILVCNAWIRGEVVNALILEGICLGIFVWSLVRRCRRWTGVSVTILILVALYMTKEFWLSISWWVYLLAAGIGLIVFAAVNEKRKRE